MDNHVICACEASTGLWTKEKFSVTSLAIPEKWVLFHHTTYVTIDQAGEFICESWNPIDYVMQYDMYI